MGFNNNGNLSVQSGVLALGGGGTGINGTFNATAGSRIDWTAGNVFLNGNTSFSGGGTNRVSGAALTFGGGTSTLSGGNNFEVAAGGVAGTNSFAGAGAFNWTGGTIGANLSLGPAIGLNLSGTDSKTMGGYAVLSSAGLGTWTGAGNWNFYGNALFSNSGTFTVLGDAQVVPYGYSGVFINNGTFLKAGGTNTTFTWNGTYGGVGFNNNGTVDVRSGVLTLGGGYTPSPTSQLKLALGGLAPGTQFNQLNIGGAAALAGTLGISLANNFTPTNGQSFAIVNYSSRTGQFTSTQFPPLPKELKWQLTYNVNSLLLQVVPANLFQNLSLTNNGNFQFSFIGETGSASLIEASTNLVNWDPLLTNTPFNGSLIFVDPQTTQFPQRFYRVTIFP